MKLLSPKQVNKRQTSLHDKQVRKGVEISNLLKRGKQELDKLNKHIEKTKNEFSEEMLNFSKEISNDKRKLEAEVAELEQRKKLALEPIEKQELMLDTKIEKLSDLDTILDEKQANIDEKQVDLDIKEADLLELRNELDKRDDELSLRENILKDKEAKFDWTRLQFIGEKFDWKEKQIKDKEEITKLKRDYKIKLNATTNLQESLKEQQIKLNKEQQHLSSQQQSLKSAFAEANKKGIKYVK